MSVTWFIVVITISIMFASLCICPKPEPSIFLKVTENKTVRRPSRCVGGLVQGWDYAYFIGTINLKWYKLEVLYVGFKVLLSDGIMRIVCNLTTNCNMYNPRRRKDLFHCECTPHEMNNLTVYLNMSARDVTAKAVIYVWAIQPDYKFSPGIVFKTPVFKEYENIKCYARGASTNKGNSLKEDFIGRNKECTAFGLIVFCMLIEWGKIT
ncbi:uncharacterized protein LOC106061343 isoform X1 [Biomphalaria glabrata]|uniref:Uncharacterized protein LOC106061343 isoform X1 n=2 Tax=Biomphalaria glabrata TaxID=6526 RepID=A0A9U8E7E0_BIOGL|nr:uncharacterized protein LOC106061343 isoform X1 [Biomphalaria glabrata]XP_013074888.2 uncharacterized protein LOC106061343 isoform X1 [Biomphalaria glabrata]XP_055861073.1 uncharacterized protein LOC106061343 isoform X1 [Biomphalaria glabrata]